MRLKDKVAIVTGSGSGMGRSAAILFAKEGAKVIVAELFPEAGEETLKMLKKEGGEGAFIKTDVSKGADCKAAVDLAVKNFGKLTVLYNNAGIEGAMSPLKDYPEDAFDRVVAVNLRGVFMMSKMAVPAMIKAGGGSIINTASTFAYVGSANWGPYCATKSAILGLTRTMGIELAPFNIRTNCICPAAVVTAMHARYLGETLGHKLTDKQKARIGSLIFESAKLGELFTGTEEEKAHLARHPIGRFAAPIDVAKAALFLASDESSYITASSLFVDGGYTAI